MHFNTVCCLKIAMRFKSHITIQDGVKPDILNPHRVSYALKDEIEKEFNKL